MMNARDDSPATPGLATSLRVTTIVVVVGTLLAIWSPAKHDSTTLQESATSAAALSAPTAREPDMSVYFPSQFPAPAGPADEPQPPTF
jgi:hypothetical protein